MAPFIIGSSTDSSPTSAGLGVQPRRAPRAPRWPSFAQWLFQVFTPVLEFSAFSRPSLPTSWRSQEMGFPISSSHVGSHMSYLCLCFPLPHPPTLPSPPKPNSPPVPWTPVPSWVFEPRFPYMLSHLGLFTFLAYLKQLIDMRGTHNLQG